ncbi:MAG: fibronectin type III-like domain-contianing protein, partial [Odoribacter sp.]|nr:fibronectin type III-like domain-contianing protein [Odoribacter sp.]
YPFGYGLSYTGFAYSRPQFTQTEQGYEFSCTVTNTGKIPGKEVVQLYIAAPGKTMVKPQKELKAFAKTKVLAPGESEVVRLAVGLSELASFDEQASCWTVESGRYLAFWCASSRDCRLKQPFTLRRVGAGKEVHRALLPVRQLEELY